MSNTSSNEYYLESKEFDKTFVLTIIQDLRKLLIYLPTGVYGKQFFAQHVYEAKATSSKVMTLNSYYSGLLIYFNLFKEQFPKNPNVQQIERINAIFQAIGHPENKIPLTQ